MNNAKTTADPFLKSCQYVILPLILIALFTFYLQPHIDLAIASYIHEKLTFDSRMLHYTSQIISIIGWILPVGISLYYVTTREKKYLFLLTCYASSNIVTHLMIKPIWGRLRPYEIFPHHLDDYTSIFQLSNACQFDCSFISGHTGLGFFLFSFAFIYPKYRYRIILTSVSLGLCLGLIRMLEHQHFLSDIIFSALVNMLIITFVALTCSSIKESIFKPTKNLDTQPNSITID